jgi:polygalacturonase
MGQPDRLWRRFLCVALTLFPLAAKAEEVRVGTRQELAEALRNAKGGTTILVAPGTYRGGLARTKLRGTRDEPIVIAGADPAKPPVIEGAGSGLHLSSPEHVELRDLMIAKASGNGLNIDDSGSTSTPARDVVLKNIAVRDVGPRGNRDGIKLSGVNNFRIENCQIERWGSSGSAIDVVGCRNGVVKGCKFLDGGESANGVQTKGGSSEIVIQRCRFQNAGGRAVNLGGSTGLAYFRPANAEFEAASITVEDCEFIDGTAAIAFVGVDGALVPGSSRRGTRALVMLFVHDEVQTGLQLTETQKQEVAAIRAELTSTLQKLFDDKSPGAVRSRLDAFRQDSDEKLLKLLTADQRAKWDTMIGPAFSFDPREFPIR